MPSSAVRTSTDPDEYFAGIRNLPIEGLVLQRGEFRAESTHIDLPRLLMYRADENLPRIMRVTPSGTRAGIVFATDSGQPVMLLNGIEITGGQISRTGLDWEWYLRSSAPCKWGSMSLTPEGLAAAGEAIIGRELLPATFARTLAPPPPAMSRLRKLHGAAAHLAKTAPDILAKPGGSASAGTGVGGSNGFLPAGYAFQGGAQRPTPSCESDGAPRRGVDGEP